MTAFRFHLDRFADPRARWANLDWKREQAEHNRCVCPEPSKDDQP